MRRVIIGSAAALAVAALGATVLAETVQYRSDLDASQEVAAIPVVSSAEATLKLKLETDGMSARYDLKITEAITGAFMAHLHRGAAGTNGPVGVWLFPHPAPPPGAPLGTFDGHLATDTIEPADLCFSPTAPWCTPTGPNWEGFLADINAGNVYVNVHTSTYPAGEVRGQVHAHP